MDLAPQTDYQQTWYFDEQQVSHVLQKAQLSEELFYKTLYDYNTNVIYINDTSVSKVEEQKPQTWRKIEGFTNRMIYEDDHTQIFLPFNIHLQESSFHFLNGRS